jgi:hypothetical protein
MASICNTFDIEVRDDRPSCIFCKIFHRLYSLENNLVHELVSCLGFLIFVYRLIYTEIFVCCLLNNFENLIVCKVRLGGFRSFVADMVIVICKVIAVYLNYSGTVVFDLMMMICIANFGYPLLSNSYFVVDGYRWNLCDIEKIYCLCRMICKYRV